MVNVEAREWWEASQRREVRDAVERIHQQLADEVRLHKPLCLASGSCCRFDEFEHRLYATGLEATLALDICSEQGRGIGAEDVASARQRGGCPWQEGRLCTARRGRPVGCRVFFCDPRLSEWVPQLAEWAHGAIKRVHEEFQVPYSYGEWRDMLEQAIAARELR